MLIGVGEHRGQRRSKLVKAGQPFRDTLKKHGWSGVMPTFFTSLMDKGKEVIVLEDMGGSRFKTLNVAQGLDDEHMKLVLSTLSQIHDAAASWKSKETEDYNNIVSRIKDTTILDVPDEEETTMQKIIVNSSLDAAIAHSAHHFGKEYAEKVEIFKKNVFKEMPGWFNSKNSTDCLIHGNYWNDSFMFRYKEKTPVEMAITDWQQIRVGSPLADLSLVILSSASVKSLEQPLSLVGYYRYPAPEKEAKKELKRVGKFGFTMALINILFACVEEELPLDQIIKGILRSSQLKDQGFRKLTMRVASIVKAAANMDII